MSEIKSSEREEDSRTLLCIVPTFDRPMLPLELDEYVAREILKWKMTKVRANGGECEILTPTGQLPEGIQLFEIGRLHVTCLVPTYSRSLQHALCLARQLGFERVTIATEELCFRIPELIVRCVIDEVLATAGRRIV